jgi:excisionase family DNA binding protein
MEVVKPSSKHCNDVNCACQKHFVIVSEAAQLLRKSERTIYRWLEDGYLPARKIKNGWLIKTEDLFALLE